MKNTIINFITHIFYTIFQLVSLISRYPTLLTHNDFKLDGPYLTHNLQLQ
jgi:hypothetical protein